jgi:uncharacterized protein (DUF1330 family)
MAAYIIVNIEITDPERYQEYIKVAPASIAKFNGKYLARGGKTEKLEGAWDPKRVVVLEFDTYENAKAWWSCEEYSRPKKLRQSAAATNMILVEGMPK